MDNGDLDGYNWHVYIILKHTILLCMMRLDIKYFNFIVFSSIIYFAIILHNTFIIKKYQIGI